MSSDSIKVLIRARPHKECNTGFVPWIIDGKNIYQIDENKTIIGDTYSYDEVFNVNTKNVDIYQTAISSLVSSAIEGINLTILAYGAASSGKTYTMNGIPEDPGIIPRFIEHIFDEVELYSQRKFLIRVSYVEVYNEIINDLLDNSNKDLKIREDIHNCVSYNPKEQIVKSSGECMQIMKTGEYNRSVGERQMNQCSSRSHAIFRIVIESASTSGGENDPVQVSHVNLIDLAVSGRVSQTGATGQRFEEGAHINKSLTALELVMKQLVEENEYVNRQDSQLTRILFNSLDRNAKTIIICNINLLSLEDTASTLMFAQRAKAVKNKPKVNEVMTEVALTKKYAKELGEIIKLTVSEFEENKQLDVEREMSNKKISELDSRTKSSQEIFVKKDPDPKRRHTFCTLSTISEERDLENASNSLITVDQSGEGDNRRSSGFDSTFSPPRRNTCVNGLECGISINNTPTKYLRDRLEILTREHEELIEYTRLEKCENQEKAEQIKIDYEFILETQKKKFQRRESELLEQIKKFSKKTEIEQPASIDNLPHSNNPALYTFEHEEISEKIASCKKQIEELQNNSQTLKLENEDLNAIIADLRKSVNSLELQNSELKIKNEGLQSKVLDMELKVNNSQQAADLSIDELYESQDNFIEVTEDLDIDEKKSSSLKKQLNDEKEMRQKVEKDLQTEVELREDSESELVKERVLRQEAESELVKETILRQEAELELAKERVLRQETETKYFEEVELRKEIKQTLYTLKKILEQQNYLPTKMTNTIIINKHKESDQDTSEIMNECYLDVSDAASLNYTTPNESMQEIDQENLDNFSSTYFKDSGKSNNFMNSFVNNDNEVSQLRQSIQPRNYEKEEKYDTSLSELEKLRKDLNSMKLQRESDIITINKLQTQLDEYGCMNLSDSEKMNEKMNTENYIKVMREGKYNLENKMESESHAFQKCHVISSNQEIKMHNLLSEIERSDEEQEENNKMLCDGDKKKVESLLNIIKGLNNDIQNLSISYEYKKGIIAEINSEKINLEKEKVDLYDKINDLIIQVRMQKDNIAELNEIIENKELSFQTLSENKEMVIKERNNIHSIFKGESEKNVILLKNIEKLEVESENLSSSLKEKEIIIAQISKEKSILEEEKTDLTLKIKNQYAQLEYQKEIEILWNQSKKEVNDLLNKIEEIKNEIENLSIVIQDKEKINDNIEKINLQKENGDLCETINDIKFQVQTQTNHLRDFRIIVVNKELGCQKMMKEYEMLQRVSEQIELTLKEEREKNVDLLKNFRELEFKIEKLYLSEKEREMIIVKINTEKTNLEEERNNLLLKISDLYREVETSSNKENESNINELKDETENSSMVIQNKDIIIGIIEMEKIDLEKEKRDLLNNVNNLMIQVQTQKNHNAELSEIIEYKELSSEKIVKENEVLKKEHELIHSTLEEEREKNHDLATNFEKLKIDNEKLFLSAEEKESIITQITAEKIYLEQQSNDHSLKINDLLTKIEEQDEKMRRQNEILEDKDLSLQNLSKEYEKFKEENKKNAIFSKSVHHENLSRNIEELTMENAKLSTSLRELSNINREKINENRSVEKCFKQENDVIFSKMKNEKEKQKLLSRIDHLNGAVETQLIKMEELQEVLKELQVVLNNNEIHIKKLETYNHELEQDMKKKEVLLTKEREQREKNIDCLKKIEKSSIDIQYKDLIIAGIQMEKINLEKEKRDLVNNVNNLITQVQTQTNHIAELSEIIENKELSSEKIVKENEILKKEQELITSALEEEREKNQDLATNIEKLEIAYKNLLLSAEEKESIITQSTAEKIDLEQQRNDLSLKINELLTKIEDKELSLQKVSKEYEKFKEENKENAIFSKTVHHENLLRNIEELKLENAKLSTSVRELSNINSEKMNQIRSVEKSFKQENDLILSNMNNERMEHVKEKQKLQSQINHLEATVETQLIKMKELETYNHELEQDMKKKELLLTKEREQVLILENNCKLIEELKRKNSTSMEGLEVLLKSKEALEDDLFDLRADFSEKLGDHIRKMKSLLGIEEKKSFGSRMIQRKLETKWKELKKIENEVSALIKRTTATLINKTKVEEVERMNKKLSADIQSLKRQNKVLQMILEEMRTDNEIAISDNEKLLHHENNKLKTMYVTHEQDKNKKMKNLEYELQTISKKTKPAGNSNYNSENNVSDLKNSEDKWKQQRAEAHDSRRSIDLNTLCSESNAFKCKCENMDEKVQEMKSEISKLEDLKEVLSQKYEKAKKLCRIRNDQIEELNE